MQEGKYRITVTRSTEVRITIADKALFLKDYTAWKNMYGDSADDVTEEDFLAARAIMSVAGGNGGKYSRGITIIHLHSDQEIEHHRTCRHCGCTDSDACQLESGNCDWYGALDCFDFATAIRRELKLRQETYPRMMKKKVKGGYTEAEQIELATQQRIQYELLDDALRAIEHGQPLDTMHAHAVLIELQREMKCRKVFYGYLVWKKKITKEGADYEKSVWAALIEYWKENYCTPARDDWYFDAGKQGYQEF